MDRERKAIIRRRAPTRTAKGKRQEIAFSTPRQKARRLQPANRHPREWWRDLTDRLRAKAGGVATNGTFCWNAPLIWMHPVLQQSAPFTSGVLLSSPTLLDKLLDFCHSCKINIRRYQ